MTLELLENEKDNAKFDSFLSLKSKSKFNISSFTIPFSKFKSNSKSFEENRTNNIKKLSKYSKEFKDILRKELL